MTLNKDQEILSKAFLTPFYSAQQLRDWCYTFLDIDFPLGHIDDNSNSSPAEWLYEAYSTIRDNKGGEIPSYVIMSSRDSYKTLTTSALAVIAMVHFKLTVALMAAIEPQSRKSIEYVNAFLRKIKPYLKYHQRDIKSQNTRNISIMDKDGNEAYVTIIICTLAGANSSHTNIFIADEVDVVRFPQAYEEAKMIPGVLKGRYPITIYTSTRKFAFGLMQKEIDLALSNQYPVLNWNLIDITEKCPPSRHKPDETKELRYISRRLPLRNLSQEEYAELNEKQQMDYDEIEAYAGCTECPLLPVCKKKLAERNDNDIGGLYKPIDFTINQFKKVAPDMAEAQLLCWKPSSTGLVYPRFNSTINKGNIITLSYAWEKFTGSKAPKNLTLSDLIYAFQNENIRFYAGVDWGYTHNYTIVVGAILPNGEFWIFETLAIPKLEFEDQLKYAKIIRDRYNIVKWFADTSMPSSIKTFRKNKMPCKDFKKDVMGGIESIRGQIIDANNTRKLQVIQTTENQILIDGFKHHHFKLDAQGNPTLDPDDEEFADVMDALRYIGQNLFNRSGRIISPRTISDNEKKLRSQRKLLYKNNPQKVHADFLTNRINELSSDTVNSKGKNSTGSVIWDFGSPLVDDED